MSTFVAAASATVLVETFARAGVIDSAGVHFAGALHRLRPQEPDTVLLAAALALRAPQWGHVCVEPQAIARTVVVDESRDGSAADLPWPAPGPWTEALAASQLVTVVESRPSEASQSEAGLSAAGLSAAGLSGTRLSGASSSFGGEDGELRPLVWDGRRLYLHRYWAYEQQVTGHVLARVARDWRDPLTRAAGLPSGFDELFPPAPSGSSRARPASSGSSPERPAPSGSSPARPAYSGSSPARPAPSGSAPARPASSGSSPERLMASGSAAQRKAAQAVLAQRLTVITGGPGTGKTHTIAGIVGALLTADHEARDPTSPGLRRPLQIALAAPTGKAAQRLTEALRGARDGVSDDTRRAMAELQAVTIHRLLGARRTGFVHDAHNPLSADVVVIDETSMVSLPLMARLLDAVRLDARVVLVGDPQQLASVEAGSVLRDLVDALEPGVVIELDHVFRQAENSPIIALARAIEAGDIAQVLRLFADPSTPLSLVDPNDESARRAVETAVAEHARQVVELAGQPQAALVHLQVMRVLTATRRGPTGPGAWNQRVEARLGAAGRSGRHAHRWYPGRPVIVTENDYLNKLMNGDIGLTTGSAGDLRVAFARTGGVDLVAPTRLQAIETVWAMTIHKSQGSEFDKVVVTLPSAPSPLLTRELLYTAVTRARRHVTVVADETALRAAVGRSISRSSGLADRLAGRPNGALGDRTPWASGTVRPPGRPGTAGDLGSARPRQLRLWD